MSAAAIVIAAALVTVPGAALSLLLWPSDRASIATDLGLVVPLGTAWVGVVSLLLALVQALTLPAFLVLYSVGGAAFWFAVIRRGDLWARARAWRTQVAAEAWTLGASFAILAALAATRLTYSPVLNLGDQTPLRYWADGLEMADAHRIPALTLQWGRLVPSTVSKVVLNAFDAAASLVLGRGPLGPMGALLVVGSIGLLLVTFALARELGLRLTAPLVVMALFANHVLGPRSLTDDLVNFRAETWGRLLVLAAVVVAVRALRSQRWPEATAAGVLFGLGAGTHLVPALVGGTFLGGYLGGILLFGSGHRAALVRTAAGLAGAAVLVGAFVLLAPRGDVGFQGAGDTSVYRTLAAELGQPPGWDPTRFLALGELTQASHEGVFYEPPSSIYHEYVRRAVGEERLRRPFLVILPVAGALALVALLVWGTADVRALAVASAVTAAVILGVALAFSFRFDVYVLAEFGPRRLFDYTAIPAVLLAAAVIELGLQRLGRRAAPAAAAIAVLAAAVAVPRNVSSGDRERFFHTALGPLEWIERNVPCGGRILADRRTLATFEALTRRAGVTEGMGPYLRPAVLVPAVRELLEARGFFRDPGATLGYLGRRAVAAVVVTSYDQTLGGVGGPLKAGVGSESKLRSVPTLELAAASPTVKVYRVITFDPSEASAFPDVRGLPGYRC